VTVPKPQRKLGTSAAEPVWWVDFLNGRYVYLTHVTDVDDRGCEA
jgi:hypothetical protein